MDGEQLKMVLKTLYGIIPYSGTMALAIIWFGIALASAHDHQHGTRWVWVSIGMLGYTGLFLMLGSIAAGNPMFGMEINAWINRTLGLIGFVFSALATYSYLRQRWVTDKQS